MTQIIKIASEDDVIKTLKDIIENKMSISADSIEFHGWPTLVLHLEGPKYHQSITPTVMHNLLSLQREIYRAYAITRYNTTSTRNLTKEERNALEFSVEVESGSSELEINLQELLLEFIKLAGTKMQSEHIVITLLGTALLYFGSTNLTKYLDGRRQIREAEIKSEEQKQLLQNMRFSSEEETKRAKIMSDIIKKDYRLENLDRFAYDVHTSLVRSASASEDANIQGVPLGGDIADILTQNPRRKSKDIRIDGTFRLLKVDSTKSSEFKVTVKNIDSGETIDAVVQDDSLTNPNKTALQNAEWSRIPVFLKINARQVGEDIKSAIIIDVQQYSPLDQADS